MLAHAGAHDCLVELAAVAEDLVHPADGVLRDDRVREVRELERVGFAPRVDLAERADAALPPRSAYSVVPLFLSTAVT